MWVITLIFLVIAALILNHYLEKKGQVVFLSLFFAVLEFTGAVLFGSLTVRDFTVGTIQNVFAASDPIPVILGSGLVAFIVIWLICLLIWITEKYQQQVKEVGKSKRVFYAIVGISTVFSFVGFLAFSSAKWVSETFGGVGIQEIMYTISQPIQGTDTSQVYSYFIGPLNNSLFFSLAFALIMTCLIIVFYPLSPRLEKKRLYFSVVHSLPLVTSVVVLFLGGALGIGEFGYTEVKAYFFDTSDLYEKNYVDPVSANIVFPEKKRNLIYIFVESLETTYLSKELGGDMDNNLMPNLSRLVESGEAINFSNTEQIGGSLTPPGTGFTVGAMVAQTAGVPLNVVGGLDVNFYGETDNFLPGVYSLGEILEDQDYRQMLLIGSDGNFAGRDKYFQQHGNYEVRDLQYAQQNGWVEPGYRIGWGYEDEKLMKFAKESLTELGSSPQPFNFTMLTVNTHFPDGLLTEETEETYDFQYYNVIQQADRLLSNLISWIKEQPFYNNTTIVLSGDHLTMDTKFAEQVDEDYTRTVFNLIMNSPEVPINDQDRQFTTMDLFPTTLAAIGAKVDGDRLGLGTNLFSDIKTLPEIYGYESVSNQLSMRSKFYEDEILKGSDVAAKKTIDSQ